MEKEEIIELIRKKIIIGNNPECNNYEEARKKELSINGCKILIQTQYRHSSEDIFINETQEITILKSIQTHNYSDITKYLCNIDNGLQSYRIEEKTNFLYNLKFGVEDLPFGGYKKTLFVGFPLTLERVIVAIGNIFFCYSNNEMLTHYCQILISCCKWQPNKTLEEQSFETIKSIYGILFYEKTY